jgi:hypothetical protein
MIQAALPTFLYVSSTHLYVQFDQLDFIHSALTLGLVVRKRKPETTMTDEIFW